MHHYSADQCCRVTLLHWVRPDATPPPRSLTHAAEKTHLTSHTPKLYRATPPRAAARASCTDRVVVRTTSDGTQSFGQEGWLRGARGARACASTPEPAQNTTCQRLQGLQSGRHVKPSPSSAQPLLCAIMESSGLTFRACATQARTRRSIWREYASGQWTIRS